MTAEERVKVLFDDCERGIGPGWDAIVEAIFSAEREAYQRGVKDSQRRAGEIAENFHLTQADQNSSDLCFAISTAIRSEFYRLEGEKYLPVPFPGYPDETDGNKKQEPPR